MLTPSTITTGNSGKNNPKYKVPKLKNEMRVNNYGTWALKIQMLCKGMHLWKYIEGPELFQLVIPNRQLPMTVKGRDNTTKQITQITIDGNNKKVDKAIEDAAL